MRLNKLLMLKKRGAEAEGLHELLVLAVHKLRCWKLECSDTVPQTFRGHVVVLGGLIIHGKLARLLDDLGVADTECSSFGEVAKKNNHTGSFSFPFFYL